MNGKLGLALLAVLLWVVPASWGQAYGDEEKERPREQKKEDKKEEIPSAGFWPTQRMMELFIERTSEDLAERYDFDEDQLYNTQELFKERFPRWLTDNRARIQTVLNEFIEAQLAGEAPDPEHVADWAQRALPLLEDFQGLVHETSGDMREYLTEEQQLILAGELAAFDTGVKFTSTKLYRWREGGYDPEVEWVQDRRDRRRIDHMEQQRLEQDMNAARHEAIARAGGGEYGAGEGEYQHAMEVRPQNSPRAPGKQAAAQQQATDEWARYVEDFIRRYQLNEEQQNSARRTLEKRRTARDNYLARKGAEMERIQKLFKTADTAEAVEQAEASYKKLNEPVERMFTQLKEKLNSLPTRKQRQQAAKGEPDAKVVNETGEPARGAGPRLDTRKKRESPSSP
ncbi:MAG: hypothetical protein KKB50_18260 [Planctomycetes bacterium]|nr:hypothetical protein [Planctomycetota bacterium]